MANKAMWDWMDKAEGKKEGSSFEGMNKERERQGYKKQSSPTKTKALESKKQRHARYKKEDKFTAGMHEMNSRNHIQIDN